MRANSDGRCGIETTAITIAQYDSNGILSDLDWFVHIIYGGHHQLGISKCPMGKQQHSSLLYYHCMSQGSKAASPVMF